MPQAIPIAIALYKGYTAVSTIAAAAYYALAAIQTYGAITGPRKARAALRAQRDAYNASLSERTVSVVSADNPWQIVYGEAIVGASFVAILTSGDRDQFKHLVAVWAAHECTSFEDVLLAGETVGTLDGSGNVTSGSRWYRSSTGTLSDYKTVSGAGVITTDQPVAALLSITERLSGDVDAGQVLGPADATFSGTTVTLNAPLVAAWAGKAVDISYETTSGDGRLRVVHHLGSSSQTADAGLLAEFPTEWSSSDRGRGLCYSVLRYDLNEPEFQGGPLQPTARLRGAKVYDPRLDSTQPGGSGSHRRDDPGTWAYSRNVALCVADFIRAEYGKRARADQVVWASVIAAANVCDEVLTVEATSVPRYTCNGRFSTADDPDTTLDMLCQAMAGFATFTGGAWYIQAGAYTAPVMALTDADNAGPVEMVPSPAGSELLNSLRGRYFDPARYGQLTDYVPYVNAGFVAADGEEYVDDLDLPFTDSAWRAHNLARIQVERSRGMRLVYPAKMRALRLQPGQRVTLTCAALNLAAAVFRVEKREYELGGAVKLTLVFDSPDFYDEVDAPAPLLPPTVSAPNPFVVAPPANLAALSDGTTLLRDGDGTVISRVKLSYDASTDMLVRAGGWLEVEYRLDYLPGWQRAPNAPGDSTECYLQGLKDRRVYVIRARWRNGLAASDWRSVSVRTDGASAVSSGYSVYTASVYLQAGSAPSTPTGGSYNFSTNTLTPPAGWSATQPATTTTPTYLAEFTFSTTTPGVTVTGGTWTAPVVDAVAGSGAPGADGISTLTLEVYLQSAGTPAAPTGGSYTFSTDSLTAPGGGWTRSMPTTTTTPTWRTAYTFSTSTPATPVSGGTWSTPVIVARNGENGLPGVDGSPGLDGMSVARVYIYQRSGSGAPALPSATATYTFSSGALTGLNNGWSATIPAGTDPLYVSVATAASSGASDTITSGEWATAVVLAENGADGGDGLNSATVYLFQRTATSTPPSLPSASVTYTFATGVATGMNNGWVQSLPTTGGAYRWVTTASALSTGATDTLSSGEWATAALLAEDGTPGSAGTSTFTATIYKQDTIAPSAPSGGTFNFTTAVLTPPSGWSATPPAASITTLTWTSTYTFSTGTPGATVTAGTWATPAASTPSGVQFPGVEAFFSDTYTNIPECTVRFKRDGTVEKKEGYGSFVYAGNWYTAGSSTVGDGYWLRVTKLSGATLASGTLGSWQQLNADRDYRMTLNSIGDRVWTGLAQFSGNSGGTDVQGAGQIGLSLEGT